MSKKKLSKLISACVLLLISSFGVIYFNVRAQDNTVIFDNVELSATYSVGETLTIPSITARLDNTNLDVSAMLKKGDFIVAQLDASSIGQNFTFKQAGVYDLIYLAKKPSGSAIVKSQTINVVEGLYFDAKLNGGYKKGETINLAAKLNGDNIQTTAQIYFTAPNSTKQKLSDTNLTLQSFGLYTIEYRAEFGGKTYERLFTINSAAEKSPKDYFIPIKGVSEILNAQQAPAYASSGSGVLIKSESREVAFRYSSVIDLNTLSKTTNLLKALPMSTNGFYPISNVKISLIDIYNPTNVISYTMYNELYNTDIKEWTYYQIAYKNKKYALDNIYGSGKVLSFPGAIASVNFNGDFLNSEFYQTSGYYGKAKWIEVQTDYVERQFFANATSYYQDKQALIVDLDDSTHVGFGNEWEGFTTGEIYLQISYENKSGNSGILVSQIAGDDLSGTSYNDNTQASLYLDFDMQALPDGAANQLYYL